MCRFVYFQGVANFLGTCCMTQKMGQTWFECGLDTDPIWVNRGQIWVKSRSGVTEVVELV